MGTWLGVGYDPRYTPSTTFETFAFSAELTPDRIAADYANDPRTKAIAQAAKGLFVAREQCLHPAASVVAIPEAVPGFPDRLIAKDDAEASASRARTLTALYNRRYKPEGAWLDAVRRVLDEVVAAVYGWPANLPDEDFIARLLEPCARRSSI
jgi:hypothetical protein